VNNINIDSEASYNVMNINTKEGLIWDGRLFFTWLSIADDVEHNLDWNRLCETLYHCFHLSFSI